MLLFTPSAGQVADRLSILLNKRDKAVAAGADIRAIETELQHCALSLKISKQVLGTDKLDQCEDLFGTLYRRNQKQWELEDAVRAAIKALPEEPSYEELLNVVNIERENCRGNEHRAELVKQIDILFGAVPEYKAYQ